MRVGHITKLVSLEVVVNSSSFSVAVSVSGLVVTSVTVVGAVRTSVSVVLLTWVMLAQTPAYEDKSYCCDYLRRYDGLIDSHWLSYRLVYGRRLCFDD